MHIEERKNYKKNSVLSLLSLFFQSGYSAFLGLVANLVLTIILTPGVFGIYIITLSIISFLKYFSDIGLAASLVQKDEVTQDDLKTTFTIQQSLILGLIVIGFFSTSFIRNMFSLPGEAVYLFWALLGSFFLSSLKTIPSILLERKVQFQKIVLVQIVEDTCFYIVVSVLAIMNFGLFSFVYAVMTRAIVGVILMYSISFWIPAIGISKISLKKLLSFGVPFQANSMLALVKDDLIMLYLGATLGPDAVGYIGWAKKWAEAPIRLVMDNVTRILFPVFSRFKTDLEKISKLTNKVIFFQSLFLIPSFVGAFLLMDKFVNLIPKYNKWEPAVMVYYLLAFSAVLSSYSSPILNLFNAIGKIKISFKFMVYWTVMSWILIPFLTRIFGIIGFPLSQIVLSFAFVIVLVIAKKIIELNFLKQVFPAVISSTIMGTCMYVTLQLQNQYLAVLTSILIGGSSYFLSLILLFKINLIKEVRELLSYD